MANATINDKISCERCHREFYRKDFYMDKNSNPMKKCKQCMASMIDLNSRSTVMPILEEVDIPFIPEEWELLRSKYEYSVKDGKRTRNPKANQSVLGRYLSKMKLVQYRDLRYSDSEDFISKSEDREKKERQEAIENFTSLLDKGLSPEEVLSKLTGKDEEEEEEKNEKLLTQNQMRDLRIKWGDAYEEDELLRLQTFYNEMVDSYEITSASHEDYLKNIVKTSLRMTSAIDSGDVDSFEKYSRVYDKLMKSAKFTASQVKEDERFIDSISEMVRLCEEQGFIPRYHIDEPQDIVDVTLRDLNNYTKNLIQNELNLDSLIEQGIEQIKLDEEKDRMEDKDMALFDDDEYNEEDIFKRVEEDLIEDQAKYGGVIDEEE